MKVEKQYLYRELKEEFYGKLKKLAAKYGLLYRIDIHDQDVFNEGGRFGPRIVNVENLRPDYSGGLCVKREVEIHVFQRGYERFVSELRELIAWREKQGGLLE